MGAILGTFWPKAATDTLAAIHHNILLKTMELALPQKPQPSTSVEIATWVDIAHHPPEPQPIRHHRHLTHRLILRLLHHLSRLRTRRLLLHHHLFRRPHLHRPSFRRLT